MKSADEYQQISSSLYFWQAFEPSVKADLSCSAVIIECGMVFIDPIPLQNEALEDLASLAVPCGIILTNGNHERAAADYRKRFGIPIYAHRDAKAELPADLWVDDNDMILGNLKAVALPGFGLGEMAIHHQAGEGTLLMGDAIINAGSMEFSILPDKYCLDQKQGRCSLAKLLDLEFQTMLFAHGTPIISGAKNRLKSLL